MDSSVGRRQATFQDIMCNSTYDVRSVTRAITSSSSSTSGSVSLDACSVVSVIGLSAMCTNRSSDNVFLMLSTINGHKEPVSCHALGIHSECTTNNDAKMTNQRTFGLDNESDGVFWVQMSLSPFCWNNKVWSEIDM